MSLAGNDVRVLPDPKLGFQGEPQIIGWCMNGAHAVHTVPRIVAKSQESSFLLVPRKWRIIKGLCIRMCWLVRNGGLG